MTASTEKGYSHPHGAANPPTTWNGLSPPHHQSAAGPAEAAYPELFALATQGPVSLSCIARARLLRSGHVAQQERDISHFLETAARDTFARQGVHLQTEYWSSRDLGVCALSTEGELFSLLNTFDLELVSLEDEILQMNRDAQEAFRHDRRGRLNAAATLFPALARLLATADAMAAAREPHNGSPTNAEAALSALRGLMKVARKRVSGMIQRQARFEYFQGALIGALITISMISGLALLSSAYWPQHISTPGFVAATIAGSIGAIVSVTQRMARNTLVLDYTASPFQKKFLGGIRALMGSVFGAIIYFALLGGFLTMNTSGPTRSTPATFAFFAIAGFAAGFSERLATDVLERAGKSVVDTREASLAEDRERSEITLEGR